MMEVRAATAFALRTPVDVAHGLIKPAGGRSLIGDTVERPVARGEQAWQVGMSVESAD